MQTNGKHAESLDRSNKLLTFVNSLNNKQLTGKKEIIANINSNIGNAHLEMGNYEDLIQADGLLNDFVKSYFRQMG